MVIAVILGCIVGVVIVMLVVTGVVAVINTLDTNVELTEKDI